MLNKLQDGGILVRNFETPRKVILDGFGEIQDGESKMAAV